MDLAIQIVRLPNEQQKPLFGCKDEHRDKLIIFERLINNQCELNFDDLKVLIKNVSLVDLENPWQTSTCTWTCKFFSKQYFCSHVIIVAVGLQLVTIPEHCENVNIGNLKKKGRPSNAMKGTPLRTQANII